jgi:hypothetical protein
MATTFHRPSLAELKETAFLTNAIFWDVALCRSPVNRRFGVTYRLHLQAGSSLADFYTLKMESIHFSETSVHTRSTQRHIPQDGILHSYRCESLKSYVKFSYSDTLRVTKIDLEKLHLHKNPCCCEAISGRIIHWLIL